MALHLDEGREFAFAQYSRRSDRASSVHVATLVERAELRSWHRFNARLGRCRTMYPRPNEARPE